MEAVLLEEAQEILEAGADCLQLDDPMLGYFTDPKYREQRSGHWGTGQFADFERRARLGIESASRLARPLRQAGAYVGLHVCRGNIERRSDAEGTSRRSGRNCAVPRWTSWPWNSRCPARGASACSPIGPSTCAWDSAASTCALPGPETPETIAGGCARPSSPSGRAALTQSRLWIRPQRHQPDPARRGLRQAQSLGRGRTRD